MVLFGEIILVNVTSSAGSWGTILDILLDIIFLIKEAVVICNNEMSKWRGMMMIWGCNNYFKCTKASQHKMLGP